MTDRLSWRERRQRLYALLLLSTSHVDSDTLQDEAFTSRVNAVLQVVHDKSIDALLFSNRDVVSLGRLANGQFGAIDLVRCSLDNKVYARKTLSKSFAYRAREQCFIQNERDLLLAARTSQTPWAPHLICAYQTSIDLCLLMQYQDGGSLWDLLEYAEGRIEEVDARWWISQAVAAICWCHGQGYVHRDIKPHNFLITSSAHLQLIDFGSSAQLLPPLPSGVQLLPRDLCLVPCGTCDYVSPEILQRYEDALFAVGVGETDMQEAVQEGYGRETDWWSFGAMIYEMVYGVAPFFSENVATTYARITQYKNNLRFDQDMKVSTQLKDLMSSLLTDASRRLGRHGLEDVKWHPYFQGIEWSKLHTLRRPTDLVLPSFTYTEKPSTTPPLPNDSWEMSYRQILVVSVDEPNRSLPPEPRTDVTVNPFAAFNWGPAADAFDDILPRTASMGAVGTPRVVKTKSGTPIAPRGSVPMGNSFVTPQRSGIAPLSSTIRRERPMSDRQAFRLMIDLVGESAQKKVLESGKKPVFSAEQRGALFPTWNSLGQDLEMHSIIDGPPSPSPRPGSVASRAASRLEGNLDITKTKLNNWDMLQRRHETLMSDIKRTEKRLQALKVTAR